MSAPLMNGYALFIRPMCFLENDLVLRMQFKFTCSFATIDMELLLFRLLSPTVLLLFGLFCFLIATLNRLKARLAHSMCYDNA